jgi:hypothetical protein
MLKDGSICNSLPYSMQMLEEKVCAEEGCRISDSAVETNIIKSFPDIAFFIIRKEDCLKVMLLLLL